MSPKYQAESQQALDDLYQEELIPFKLEARKLTEESPGEITISFYDSRLHSVVVEVAKGDSIEDKVRAAVLLKLSDSDLPQLLY